MMLSWKGARLCRFGYGAVFPFASRDDREHVIRQRPLQRLRVRGFGLKPLVDLRRRGQDDRHGLGMDRRHDRIGLGRQEAE